MSKIKTDLAPLHVVAVVDATHWKGLVLNRPIQLVYERQGNDYIGVDGPFRRLFAYERASGRFKAFAGAEMPILMADGTTKILKDHWWAAGIKGMTDIGVADVDSLKRCYVFGGGNCISPDDLAMLMDAYTGCIYPYLDYEKVIKYDDQRRDLVGRWLHEEKRRKALVSAIKAKQIEIEALRATIGGAA
jgi:hypothetical protein